LINQDIVKIGLRIIRYCRKGGRVFRLITKIMCLVRFTGAVNIMGAILSPFGNFIIRLVIMKVGTEILVTRFDIFLCDGLSTVTQLNTARLINEDILYTVTCTRGYNIKRSLNRCLIN
jgi:hypothetical protein